MKLDITFQAEDLKKNLQIVKDAIRSPQSMLGSVGETLLNINKERHRKGVDPEGTPWKPLSPLTLISGNKKRKGGPLHKSGDMMRSFHYQITGDTLTLGFENKLAKYHHFGTSPYTIRPVNKKALFFAGIFAKRVNHPGIPSRELVGIPDSDKTAIRRTIQDFLNVLMKG